MKTFTSTIIVLMMLFVTNTTTVNAQFRDYGIKGGFQFNSVMPATEFENDNGLALTSYLARAFLRIELSHAIDLEIGAGYGNFLGDEFNYTTLTKGPGEYSTSIMPIDIRFLISPMNFEDWNPYVYAGFGVLNYNVGIKPNVISPLPVEADGWTGTIPVGIGTEIKISDVVLLDLNVGVNYTLTENLNFYKIVDFNDAYFSLGAGIMLAKEDMDSDKDMDGLTKGEELEIGTDPNNPDTDNDGLRDGVEVKKYNTDPKNADSDKDGLKDGEEVNNYTTNPNKADTDNDGLSDYDEVMTYKTDALQADTDKDGLNDGTEVTQYKTDPLQADSDKDGLNDGDEINKYKTNPLIEDTDTDGLSDYDEIMKYKTNPLDVDTDKGTVNDGVEVERGTNPLDAKDDVIKIGVPIVLDGITFETNKFNITPESESVLQDALKTLQAHKDIDVEISGHTDNVGTNKYNQNLSMKRAVAVKNWLVSKGIKVDRITAVGYGEENPRVSNNSDDNRRMNRRIEFKRIK
ncbi:MAG: OmpA family protein [Bacteroidetes bacterium]|nr:OmpA family protein [Bacteroidota bacterium]